MTCQKNHFYRLHGIFLARLWRILTGSGLHSRPQYVRVAYSFGKEGYILGKRCRFLGDHIVKKGSVFWERVVNSERVAYIDLCLKGGRPVFWKKGKDCGSVTLYLWRKYWNESITKITSHNYMCIAGYNNSRYILDNVVMGFICSRSE